MENVSLSAEVDPALVVSGWEYYAEEAEHLLHSYNKELWEIMCRFEVYDEGQIISNNIPCMLKKHPESRQYGKNIQLHLKKHVQDLLHFYLEDFWKDFESRDYTLEVLRKASSWYITTYQSKSAFLSFPWIVWEVLCDMKEKNKITISLATATPSMQPCQQHSPHEQDLLLKSKH